MLICGYDDNINSFKVLNSWGSGWGNMGYIWIDYDFFKIAVVNTFMIPSIYVGVIKRPFLTTSSVGEISQSSAKGGGIITSDWGYAITERGVCWNINPNPTIFNVHTIDGNGTGSYFSNLTELSSNTTYYVHAYARNSEGIAYGNEVSFTTSSTSFYIGQNFGGGIVFYVDGTGYHGLIAATSDLGYSEWGCNGTSIPGTSTDIGAGQANTITILNGCSHTGTAAQICNDLVLNGYDDWYLPSKDELNQIYLQKNIIGGFVSGYCWSSSEYNATNAWAQDLRNGLQVGAIKDVTTGHIRAVRTF